MDVKKDYDEEVAIDPGSLFLGMLTLILAFGYTLYLGKGSTDTTGSTRGRGEAFSFLQQRQERPKRGLRFLVILGSTFCAQRVFFLIHDIIPGTQLLTPPDPDEQTQPQAQSTPVNGSMENPLFMWSLNESESFFAYCRAHILRNKTWGEHYAPFVDKLGSKTIITQLDPSIKVIPTLAHFDIGNISDFTLEMMQSLPDPYVIKGTHTSGGVARVQNGTYECFKRCLPEVESEGAVSLNSNPQKAVMLAQKQMKNDLESSFSNTHGETQYIFVPPRIILEGHLPADVADDPWKWHVVHGQPLYVLHFCKETYTTGGERASVRMSTRFQHLLPVEDPNSPEALASPLSPLCLQKPKEWDKMHRIAKTIGKQIPGLVRIDLYPMNGEVYFSELTFTPRGCYNHFQPVVTEALLQKVFLKEIPVEDATAEFVENIFNDRSWVLVSRQKSNGRLSGMGYPSPLDMCVGLVNLAGKFKHPLPPHRFGKAEMDLLDRCIVSARKVTSMPLRCIMYDANQHHEIQSEGTAMVLDDKMSTTNRCIAHMLLIANDRLGKQESHQHRMPSE